MKITSKNAAALAAGAMLAMTPSVSAHSWIEFAKKLAKNGTMIGATGYPRGYVARDSTSPAYSDSIPQNILPVNGQSAYSGNEVLNKFQYTATPDYPMLEAAAGDYIAIMHLENGHTTLPQNQPKKPLNRGTIYFYGTSQPKDEEKLFDVHLLWNKDGTGGDKRGKLLATRNYDDGQCYQTNPGALSTDRAAKYANQGAKHDEELACQSDIKLPDNLAEGSVYTVYWYWDWPDLNADAIDMNATTNGKFPWAGTFMRGQKDPNGFAMDAIARNESYSSVMDIKITGASAASFAAKDSIALDYVDDQNIYSVGIEAQMANNFQVDVGGTATGTATGTVVATTPVVSFPAVTTTTAANGGSSDGVVATVTVTQTVRPPASVTTVYVTVPADQMTETGAPESTSTTTKTLMVTKPVTVTGGTDDIVAKPSSTSTFFLTLTTHINKNEGAEPTSTSTAYLTLTTHINEADSEQTSTEYVTLTTHITPVVPAQSSTVSTSTYWKTMYTTVKSDAAKATLPGGSFQETLLPDNVSNTAQATPATTSIPGGSFRESLLSVDSSATSTATAAVQTPYRRRANWALGAF
ncbi:hypothetical protein B0T10DRAFT_22028 [Thelonectria olida]|uniref:DUF7492 domain-containing protein n=1 Tax=Thelonectria olida TaxID=1576542 RepID=A0A9P8WIT6_9HYPO|nr:hypothetical protein B0T10DRAFT_22028 [Thelonectria olida]